MYRTASDPLLVVPGEGLRGIAVGCATPDEVLHEFGADADVARHDGGDVFKIGYDHGRSGDEQADRPAQRRRPSAFLFEYGLLKAIDIGIYQSELHTTGGIRVGSTRDEIVQVFGPDYQSFTYRGDFFDRTDNIETLRYLSLGIQFGIHHRGTAGSFLVFHTRRPG